MIAAYVRQIPGYLVRDLPPFALAMAVAEVSFKFGSFTLECLGFLALWFVLAKLYGLLLRWLTTAIDESSAPPAADRE